MLAGTGSVAFVGTEAHLVEIEVSVRQGGLPGCAFVGLPTKSVREAEHRTSAAVEASGETWPKRRIVANFSPGDLRKEGTHFDLGLALGVLGAVGRFDVEDLEGWVVMGELSLGGAVLPVRGTLPAAIAARQAGRRGIICPAANAAEATVVDDLQVVPVAKLSQAIGFFAGGWRPPAIEVTPEPEVVALEDMSQVRGHETPKKALEIAAAGGHNLLLLGPPGSGKTMLARRLPGILPEMTNEEALDVTRVHSVAGAVPRGTCLVRTRPFRAPHHNISLAGLIGGGVGLARPGEISLAHNGTLFLDELALYRGDTLEALRGPLEDGHVTIVRAGGAVHYPCRFSLVAAMNPCPCGYRKDSRRGCRCSDGQMERYRSRLSGPLLDRFDMQVWMSRLSRDQLLGEPTGERSEVIRTRVQTARARQTFRYGDPMITNSTAPRVQLDAATKLSRASRFLLGEAVETGELSGRGLDRTLRIARTMADLDDLDHVGDEVITEALAMRLRSVSEEEAA